MSATQGLVSFDQVRAAAERLREVGTRTPFLHSEELSRRVDGEVRLKLESLQRSGSFKFRGAWNYISSLPREDLERGVITYSSGNHGQAMAMAAGLMGVPAVVVMPVTAPEVKRSGAEALGARVVLEGTTSLERRRKALEIQKEGGQHMVPPFDHPTIIAGQGTAALEAAEAWPEMDTWLVCIGGGGLGSGSAVTLRELHPNARIIGVEAEGAASMRASLDAGEPVTLDRIDTIADGLAPVRPGDLTFAHVQALFDDVVTVSDDAIREATRWLLGTGKVLAEYSGAAAVAAVRSGVVPLSGRRVGVTVSGGNMDLSLLARLLGPFPTP
ncbi:MAG: threonine/serine dehydratase [Gemmatimonadales bacterium]|nr:MAG: threonine/serine dehydratase [Gemmatimonadales bacterium]